MKRSTVCCTAFLLVWGVSMSARAEVNVGINIGVPPPPSIVIQAPPRVVVVPTTPAVRYAPDVDVNLFFYGGQYYTFHEGAWFVAPVYSGPWVYVERPRVPRAVLIVPARYYRIPPGQMRKYGRSRGKHHGHHGGDDDDDHDHHHGHHGHDD